MPQAYVSKLAKEYDVSIEEAESVWEQAKSAAGMDKNDEPPKWALVTAIFKRMMKERGSKIKKASSKK